MMVTGSRFECGIIYIFVLLLLCLNQVLSSQIIKENTLKCLQCNSKTKKYACINAYLVSENCFIGDHYCIKQELTDSKSNLLYVVRRCSPTNHGDYCVPDGRTANFSNKLCTYTCRTSGCNSATKSFSSPVEISVIWSIWLMIIVLLEICVFSEPLPAVLMM